VDGPAEDPKGLSPEQNASLLGLRTGKNMKIVIEIDCGNAALHDDPPNELRRILATVPGKVAAQLERDGRCICEALESADMLKDINGNTVGTVKIVREK
jgi:hypothetical protein